MPGGTILDDLTGDEPTLASVGEGPTALTVYRVATGEFLLDHATFGRYRVSPDGLLVSCAPKNVEEPWRWQRFLIGQVLPLVAVLRGFEVLHASAVVVDGEAYLFAGPSGAGKTSAALAMADHSGTLLADDVAALDVRDGVVVAHPGAAVASVEGLPPPNAEIVGTAEGETRIRLRLGREPVAVGHVVLLEPRTAGERVEVTPVAGPVAPVLLGATFNAYVRDPTRLERQFELLAALGRQARMVRAVVPRVLGVDALPRELRGGLPRPII